MATLQAGATALGRVRTRAEGFGAAYAAARRMLLDRHDDDSYHAFVKSFRFCRGCKEFVCSCCWSATRQVCLTCVARSLATHQPLLPAPEAAQADEWNGAARPPFRARLRRDRAWLALAAALAIVVLEVGSLLAAGGRPGTSPVVTGSAKGQAASTADSTGLSSSAAAGLSSSSSGAGATWPPSGTASRMNLLTPCPDVAGCYLYTVRGATQNGASVADTLPGIAVFFGVSESSIRAMNPALASTTAVYSGEVLRVPPPTR